MNIEVEVTSLCNMACKYCFEGTKQPKQKFYDISQLQSFLKEMPGNHSLVLWGGEPTMCLNTVEEIVKCYDFNKIKLYSNGYANISDLAELVQRSGPDKWDIQFSYDGNPVHDWFRLDKNGSGTSQTVLSNIRLLRDLAKPSKLELKATIPFNGFKVLPQVWEDYRTIYESDRFGLHPTIDYHTDEQLTQQLANQVQQSMVDIARKEKEFYKTHGFFLFNWFNTPTYGKKQCAAGRNMLIVDLFGDVYPCHGALYTENKDQHWMGHISSPSHVRDVINRYNCAFDDRLPKTCLECPACNCQVCNITRYDRSDYTDYFSAFYDRLSDPVQCQLFRIVGFVTRALTEWTEGDN